MKWSQTLAALCTAALTIAPCAFAVADDSGWQIGGNVGQSRANIDNERIASGLASSKFTTTSIAEDERDLGYKLFGGYRFGSHFSIEGGYFRLGTFGFTATTATGTLDGRIRVSGVNLDAVGRVPLNGRLSAFGRAGIIYSEAKDSFTGTGSIIVLTPTPRFRSDNYKFGFGVEYDFPQKLAIRAEAERYRIGDALGHVGDIDLVSLGLVYRFGRKAPAAPSAAAATPEPIRTAAPALVIVPVLAQTQQYCSILDFQFEINQDEIQREEKEKFAVLGTFLTKYPNTTAVIEGHTDNVGKSEDNMKLSQRRADGVVSYLVSELGISPSRLKAVGYGDTRPVADNSTQEGKRLNRRIGAVVACATDIEGLTVKPARITMAMLLEFDPNQADIKPEYGDELGKVANFLKANPSVTATVEGHTGNLQGTTASAAQEISQRRAQNVVNYLVDKFGIARSRLAAEGFGQTRRFAYNTSIEGQQANRRVNIIINYPK